MVKPVQTIIFIVGFFVGVLMLSLIFIKPADKSILVHAIDYPPSNQYNNLPQLGFSDVMPATWHLVAPLPMQQAHYLVPIMGEHVDNLFLYGQASVTILPGTAGGTLANVNRWYRQLNLPEQSLEALQQQVMPVKSSAGEWQLFKLSNVAQGQAIYGAILNLAGKTVFVKLQGPIETLVSNSEQFLSWLLTVQPSPLKGKGHV